MPDVSEVINFVRSYTGAGARIEISGATRLEADLGVTGDDGVDLLKAAEQHFGIEFGNDLRPVFQLDPDEVLFGDEGLPIPGLAWVRRLLGGQPPPAVADLTVEQLHSAILRCSVTGPAPPFLVVRPQLSFWVERTRHTDVQATLQAHREGCFDGAVCVDASGGLWPVVEARLRDDPKLLDRAVPSRRVPVTLRIGRRKEVSVREVVTYFADILRDESEFCDHLKTPPAFLITLLEACDSIEEVIRVVEARAT